MRYRPLGKTGIEVSEVAFGCGPVSGLFTAAEAIEQQCRTIGRAVELGINWFDTAATYGDGRSEANLGAALAKVSRSLGSDRDTLHVATKVRLFPEDLADIRGVVFHSVEASLKRLRLPAVTLLQLHNSITAVRGAQPTSITPDDVLGPDRVLSAFEELQHAGTVRHLGLTGLGEPAALIRVIESGRFETVQAPFNLLHQSAGCEVPEDPPEHNLRGLFAACQRMGMGVFAVRVFAGGALFGKPPSAHTLTTKFFPLDLYQCDIDRAARLQASLGPGQSLPAVALQFALGHPAVSSAIIGCGSPEEVEQVVAFAREAQG